jgi:hypothetical protein
VDYDDEAATATCWSKGDNGGGEGELILFAGAGSGLGGSSGMAGGVVGSSESENHYGQQQETQMGSDRRDFSTSASKLTGNNYGGGGGCVVFSIHLYRGDKRGGSTNTYFGERMASNNKFMDSSSLSSSNSTRHPYHNQRQRQNQHNNTSSYISRQSTNPSSPSSHSTNTSSSVTSSTSFSSTTSSTTSNRNQTNPDFSHGIIVECMRIRGNTMQFHKDCRAIFASAKAESDGLDDYRSSKSSLYQSPFCFRRLQTMSLTKNRHHEFSDDNGDGTNNSSNASNMNYEGEDEYENDYEDDASYPNLLQLKIRKTPSELSQATFSALERVLDLLEKDRFDAQLLGVKSLTLLTDTRSSGLMSSYMTSLCILGSKVRFSNRHGNSNGGTQFHNNTSWTAEKLHQKVISIAMGQFTTSSSMTKTNHDNNEHGDEHAEDFVDFPDPFVSQTQHRNTKKYETTPSSGLASIESQYKSTIRGYMMHVLTNALTNLIKNSDQFQLQAKPTCFEFMTKDFLEIVCEDIAGATRPPMALLGTAHEAAHAVKFLHLIASYSEEGFHAVHSTYVGNGTRNKKRPIMELLDKAYGAGLSSHDVLKMEARVARKTLRGYASKDQF